MHEEIVARRRQVPYPRLMRALFVPDVMWEASLRVLRS
jgi:hypothetical protein